MTNLAITPGEMRTEGNFVLLAIKVLSLTDKNQFSQYSRSPQNNLRGSVHKVALMVVVVLSAYGNSSTRGCFSSSGG